MDNIAAINAEISDVMNDIAVYLDQTRKGLMIDMSSLPGRIVSIQSHVQNAPRDERLRLTEFMNQMMQALNALSDEVQKQHDLVDRRIRKAEETSL